jgi:hypothetical protein
MSRFREQLQKTQSQVFGATIVMAVLYKHPTQHLSLRMLFPTEVVTVEKEAL